MRFAELTNDTLPLFERLFGPGGVQGGCWCAFFRLTGPEFERAGKDGRKAHVRGATAAGKPLGLLALADDDEPVGRVAVSPRPDNPRSARCCGRPLDLYHGTVSMFERRVSSSSNAVRRHGL
ncbi:hypothetical protein [Amycolatopsis orientalis]|uniref:hypothetical protein n=1 Tax=Amycolatopsis orientalis TaxID=31958 RepID=UPI00040A918E|nr:hypothetical protein [Amycolatopsis orientalis]